MQHGKIRLTLDQIAAHVSYDQEFLRRVQSIQEGFVNKKPEHIEFFGGTLTGVQTVRFTDLERDRLFDMLLESDEDLIEDALYKLRDEHGNYVIDRTHKRGSDVFNICTVYLIHKVHNSTLLDENQRMDAKRRLCVFMIYKFLTSLMYWYFQYPADEATAKATYTRLSMKFALKQHGSWGATLMNMANNMVADSSVHISVIEKMDHDYNVERMINDIQSRVKDMLKNIYAVFAETHASGEKIASSSSHSEIEGEIELKDRTKTISVYSRYVKGILSDKNTYIRPELVHVVTNMMPTMPPRLFNQTLTWTCDHYFGATSKVVDDAVDIVMEHAIEYLSANRDIAKTDVGRMLERLRGAYTSSRSTDKRLMDARSRVENVVRQATGSKNENAVASVRTAWMLYLVARAYTMRYYSSR